MACRKKVAILLIVTGLVLGMAMAVEYTVGDDDGWNTGVDYTAWAEGKEFRVGDRLIFKYTGGDHTVIEVGESDFEACNIPSNVQAKTSGNDVITLKNAGTKWYICGQGNHCTSGQKLTISLLPIITVRPVLPAPAASPFGPPNSSNKVSMSKYQILKVVIMLIVVIGVM